MKCLPKLKYILFFLFFYSISFSQKLIKLSGKVISDGKSIPETLIELKVKDTSRFAVSKQNGDYSFLKINWIPNSDLMISVNRIGFKSYNSNIKIANDSIVVFNVELEKEDKINTLDEVIVNAKLKAINVVGKSIYKIDKKKFIANATAFDALSTLPNVYCNKQTGEIIVEGKLEAKLFIDGIESKYSDFKSLKVTDIDKIEIINNPTSVYGSDFLGAVINVKTKKVNNSFYHGFISSSTGLINYQNSLYSNFKYKIKSFYINADFGYLKSNQISKTYLSRTDQNGLIIQNATNETKSIQPYLNTKIGIAFSKKTDITISQYFGGYTFKGVNNGTSINNNSILDYKNESETENKDFEIASVVKYLIDENKTFFFKNRLTNINDHYKATYEDANVNFFDINSKKNELILNLNYNIENVNKYFIVLTYDLKYTIRKFNYTNSNFYLDQNIFDATIETSNKWTKNFSTQTSLTFEYLSNQNNTFQKNQSLFLPTFNFLYHFEKDIDVSAGFSSKVIRPSPTELNETLLIYSPTTAAQGNVNLKQQISGYYWLKFNKQYETDYLSIKLYQKSINNSIANVYKQQNDLLIKTLDNAAKFEATGMDFDFQTNIFKKLEVSINSGFSYNSFTAKDNSILVKQNSGIGLNNSIDISTKVLKDKVSLSISGLYSGPDYTLLSRSQSYPFLDFSASTNVLKNKFKISLYCRNLLGESATRIEDRTLTDGFSQYNVTRNNYTNILVSVSYNFGKYFDNYRSDNNIQIDDIRK